MSLLKVIDGLMKDEASKEQRIKVLFRFVLAHIRFLFADSFTFEWVRGIRLNAVKHRASSTGCYYYGYYDLPEMALLEKYLKPGDDFADVGSNIGSYAIFAASCGANAFAIEPAPSTFQLLLDNIKLNPKLAHYIKPIQCAIGEEEGKVTFTTDHDSENHVMASGAETYGGAITEVPCKTVDMLCNHLNAIKIDVENYEIPVLKGAATLLKGSDLNIVIIETFDKFQEIEKILGGYGYRQYHYDVKRNILYKDREKGQGNNAIFIKNVNEVIRRTGLTDKEK